MNKDDIIKKYYEIKNSVGSKIFMKRLKESGIYECILSLTKFLDKFDTCNKKVPLKERVYCIEHNLTDRPKCINCKTNYVCSFDIFKNEYRKWCSPQCQAGDKSCIEKVKNTKLSRYGDENYMNIEKSRETRYRINNGKFHSSDFGDKVKRKKLENYGKENYNNQEKMRETKKQRYNDENYVNTDKAKKTKFEKYGDVNYNNSEQISRTYKNKSDDEHENINKKRRDTCINRYGCTHIRNIDGMTERIKNTCMLKYGCSTALESKKSRELCRKSLRKKTYERLLNDAEYIPLFSEDEYVNEKDNEREWEWKHSKCGHVFSSTCIKGYHHRCYDCYPLNVCGISNMEVELADYIRTITNHKVYNHEDINRKFIDGKYEIDILIPDLKTAFEFNGLYYHSEEMGKDIDYHLNKTIECEKNGYRLIHIFEDEWVFKKKQVKNRIKDILNVNKYHIDADNCIPKVIDNKISDKFVNKYSVFGTTNTSVSIGLFYKDRLVSILTFSKSGFNQKFEYNITRLEHIGNFSIHGAFEKMVKFFETTYSPKSIVIYADRRWSNGGEFFGFTMIRQTKPDYTFYHHDMRYNRIMFDDKEYRSSVIQNYDNNKSLVENMRENGYLRIFNCGNLVFVKNYT